MLLLYISYVTERRKMDLAVSERNLLLSHSQKEELGQGDVCMYACLLCF